MTESNWTKDHSDRANAIVNRAAQEIPELGMSPAGPWRLMLLDAIEALSRTLTPAELLVDIGRTRNWLDKLEAEAKAKDG